MLIKASISLHPDSESGISDELISQIQHRMLLKCDMGRILCELLIKGNYPLPQNEEEQISEELGCVGKPCYVVLYHINDS